VHATDASCECWTSATSLLQAARCDNGRASDLQSSVHRSIPITKTCGKLFITLCLGRWAVLFGTAVKIQKVTAGKDVWRTALVITAFAFTLHNILWKLIAGSRPVRDTAARRRRWLDLAFLTQSYTGIFFLHSTRIIALHDEDRQNCKGKDAAYHRVCTELIHSL